MIQNQSMSGHTMSLNRLLLIRMPIQPEIVRMFRMPAIPFMMFHGPPMMVTPS